MQFPRNSKQPEFLPTSNKKGLEKLLGIRIVGVKNLDETLDELFE